jgi:hypothetical protein
LHQRVTCNKAMATDHHPFHALTFELKKNAAQSKQTIHHLWAQLAGTTHVPPEPVLFSEWPLIASHCLQDKLTQRVAALCDTIKPNLRAELLQAKGWQHASAADVLTIDYAIIFDEENDADAWDIRLVEFQAFTSLLTMGYRLHQAHSQLWPQLMDCPPWQKRSENLDWSQTCRPWLAGGDNPALLEYQPWQRGTLFDLHATSALWNLPIVEPHQIEIDAEGRLFSNQNGVRTQHDKILNRLILSELDDHDPFLKQVQAVKLNWHSHPAWYFLVHKGLASEIKIPFEPENVRGHKWRDLNLPAHKLVAKNIFSCGGKDLHIGPSEQALDQLDQPENWLVQPRYRPYPVMTNQAGEKVYAEVRLIVKLHESEQPWIAMQIVRMYCAEQASASFFQGREGEGANILHRPPRE